MMIHFLDRLKTTYVFVDRKYNCLWIIVVFCTRRIKSQYPKTTSNGTNGTKRICDKEKLGRPFFQETILSADFTILFKWCVTVNNIWFCHFVKTIIFDRTEFNSFITCNYRNRLSSNFTQMQLSNSKLNISTSRFTATHFGRVNNYIVKLLYLKPQ